MLPSLTGIRNFLVSEDGPTAVEYAIMLTMILVVCISAVSTIGQTTKGKFSAASAAMQ